MAAAAPLHGSECQIPGGPGADSRQKPAEPRNQDPGMSAVFSGPAPCSKVPLRGAPLLVSVSAACSSVAATVCPWPPWQLRDPSSPPPPGPAPASSSPPTATKGKPHPDLHLGRGVRAGNLPHSLALEGYPPTPGGLGSLRAPSDGICGNRPSSPASLHFYDPMVLSHHGRRPWGPRAPLQRPGRDSGHSGTEGAGLG